MKLNNKGMTLTELIVSFVIVSVAVVYFSTTIVRIVKIYKNSQEKTDRYVEVNYIFRLLDAFIEKESITAENWVNNKEEIEDFVTKIDCNNCEIIKIVPKEVSTNYSKTDDAKNVSYILQITIKIGGKNYKFNKLLKSAYN